MLLQDLLEMTMLAGSLDYNMSRFLPMYAKKFPESYKHVGDIEDVQVWFDDTDKIYLIIREKPEGWFYVVENSLGFEIKGAYLLPSLRGKRLFEKFIWFLKKHEGMSLIVLGDVHSDITKQVVSKLVDADRFTVSWYNINTKEKVNFHDQPELGYSRAGSTKWRVIIENDGDFSDWPRFYDPSKPDIKQWYDFLIEENIQVLYRMISKERAEKLLSGKSVPITSKFTSFVKDKNHLKREFGDSIIELRVNELPSGCKLIPIRYDLAWFTQSKLHQELLKSVTGRTEQDWLDEFKDPDELDDEIETLYGDEHEIVVTGLKSLDPTKVKISS